MRPSRLGWIVVGGFLAACGARAEEANATTYGIDGKPWGTLQVIATPAYPRGPLANGVTARVDVEATVTATGEMTDADLTSDPPGADAFIFALGQVLPAWRFAPVYTLEECRPLEVRAKFSVHFDIEDGKPKVSVSHVPSKAVPSPPPERMPVKRVQPFYPDEPRRSGFEGRVYTIADVRPDGKVGDLSMHAATKSGFARYFERSTRAALEQWEWPAAADGKAWKACLVLEYKLR